MPRLPKFKTEEEFVQFVDTHDTAAYWQEMQPADANKFRIKRRRQSAVRVPVNRETLERLFAVASKRGVSLDALLQKWLSERLKQENRLAGLRSRGRKLPTHRARQRRAA